MKVDLSGKTVIVTGAASGIGQAAARLAAGSDVEALLLVDRDAARLNGITDEINARGIRAEAFVTDLAEPEAARHIIAAARGRLGRIDALVNAAGLTDRASFLDGTEADWDRLFAVNARAPFFLMQGAIQDMRSRRAPGAIVNILSINAHCGAPDLAIYSATKGALQTLTKNAANAHLADGIRVNGINLGWVRTEAEHRMQSETLGLGEDWAEKASANLPLGRLLNPEETARHVVFMLSDASAPMTGVVTDLEQRVIGA